jgi:hypothetical protein
VEILIDGNRVLRRRRTGEHGDDPETKGASAMGHGLEWFEVIFNRMGPLNIYPCAVDGTEWNVSVALRCKTTCSYCNSVGPSHSNRYHRDENLDQSSAFGGTECE